jgi:hypothetical protein
MIKKILFMKKLVKIMIKEQVLLLCSCILLVKMLTLMKERCHKLCRILRKDSNQLSLRTNHLEEIQRVNKVKRTRKNNQKIQFQINKSHSFSKNKTIMMAMIDNFDDILNLNITSLVEEWIDGTQEEHGVGVKLYAGGVAAVSYSYTNKFFSSGT